MYNAELKEKFLAETSSSQESISARRSFLNFFSTYEEENQKDLCTMDADEIQKILSVSLNGSRGRSGGTAISAIRSYIRWCIEKGVRGASSSGLSVTCDEIELMRRHTVKNPAHLKKFLNDVFSDEIGTTDEPIKCFFWLAFGGYDESSIMEIKKSDIDYENSIIKGIKTRCVLYKEGIDTIKSCANDLQFKYINSNYKHAGDIWRDRVPGDCILRGVRGSSKPDLSIFRSNISRRVMNAFKEGKTDLKLNYHKVWLSGAFYRMRELDIAGLLGDAAFRSLVKENIDSQKRLYNSKASDELDRIAFNKKVNEYRKDYENWKMTIV